jgi:hypothetical protein
VSALIVAAAVALGAVLLTSTGTGSSSGGSSSPPLCRATDGAGMGVRPILPGATYSAVEDDGTQLQFEVLDAHVQPIDSGRWLVLVHTRMTNNSKTAQEHGDFLYDQLAVEGTPYPVSCFSITAGGEVALPSLNNEAVVGFNVGKNPNGALTLVFGDKHDLPIAAAVP